MAQTSDPYARGKFASNPYAKKTDVTGPLVVVLDGKMEDRDLSLITPISRCVQGREIHELILTDEMEARPGTAVNRIAYLGFFEVAAGGVIVAGDEVYLGDKMIGRLAGFDETHMPNHLNIVIKSERRLTGLEQGAELGGIIRFRLPAKG